MQVNTKLAHQDRNTGSGFTIVELMVSLGLFAIVITIAMGALLTLVDASTKARTLQSVMTNLSFSFDSMTRDIRTGYEYYCGSFTTLPNGTQNCTGGNTAFAYTDGRNGDRVGYRFSGSPLRLERKINTGAWVPITASEVQIIDGRFIVGGTTGGDAVQPTVWIIIEGEAAQADIDSTFTVRTLVTQRRIDL